MIVIPTLPHLEYPVHSILTPVAFALDTAINALEYLKTLLF